MISKSHKYAMLIASLPMHPTDLFSTSITPLSRIRLDESLRQLDSKDAADLERIEDLLHWSQIKDASDEFIVEKSKEVVAAIKDPFLRKLIMWRLELRTLVVALRKRHAGIVPDGKMAVVGMGQWLDYLQKNWQKPDFGLGLRIPWLVKANQLLAANETYALEKLQLAIVWQHYATVSGQHFFDFPAVVIYVLRWDITNRWTHYHAESAVKRFDRLTDSALAGVSF